MPVRYKSGKKQALIDHRIPRMSIFTQNKLPPAPPAYDWSTKVTEWGMLGNDQWGDCVECAILHWIMQMSTYAGHPLVATLQEAEKFYEFTGFKQDDVSTDQGSYVLGTDGAIPYWGSQGVMCGGQLSKVAGFLQIRRLNPVEWMQGIYYFGGMLTGIQLPPSILGGDFVPELWTDYSGVPEGGHEILINGYEPTNLPNAGGRLWTNISWGQPYKMTETFLKHVIDETVVVIDPIEFDAHGVTALNLNFAQLTADLGLLRH